jgi:flagella basal body P-ring formation protein FlgA
MNTLVRHILAFLLTAVAALSSHALAGSITLRDNVTVDAAREVTVGDIALLEGPDALELASVALGMVEDTREFTLAEIRAALDARKVNWGRLALRGSACAVRVNTQRPADSPAAIDEPFFAADAAPATPGVETIRDRIIATLRELFGAEPDAMRVAIDDTGKDFLNHAINGRRVDIETSSASSSRLNIRVWMYEGDRLVVDGQARADVSLRVDVFTLSAPVGRGDRIDASVLSKATVWMAPSGAPPIRLESQAVGAVARTRLDAGTVLRTDHVEAPVVIKRGDLVTVHALAGSMLLKTKARALADAREGEFVELSRSRDRKSFLARVAGPGLAILDAGADRGE